ncbi:unnamed protein product [Ostreobium quekettii]|uniref:Uncharacterized protein n=1 Tax=Ostreobium quekettii TaxID=121088 RepID=A0A8S1IW03_9CHLO|nr:unnamed protein product [Ostreobium quekettii]
MPRKRGAARTANHPVLRRLYGDVCDLAEAVVRLVEGTGAKAEMRERLEAAGGSPKLQALLRGTRVAFPGGDPAGPRVRVPDSLSQEQASEDVWEIESPSRVVQRMGAISGWWQGGRRALRFTTSAVKHALSKLMSIADGHGGKCAAEMLHELRLQT